MRKLTLFASILIATSALLAMIFFLNSKEKNSQTSNQIKDALTIKKSTHTINDGVGHFKTNAYNTLAYFKNQQLFTLKIGDSTSMPVVEGLELELNPSYYYTKSLMPSNVISSIPISNGMVFYCAIRSHADSNNWVFVERNMKNTNYNMCLFNQKELTKKILFAQNNSPNWEYAFKPIAWSDQKGMIYMEALIFGSSTEHEGIWGYNIDSKRSWEININPKYIQTPLISPDYRYLAYSTTTETKDLHSSAHQMFLYDFETKKNTLLLESARDVFSAYGWVVK